MQSVRTFTENPAQTWVLCPGILENPTSSGFSWIREDVGWMELQF